MVRRDMATREYHLIEIQPVTENQKYGHKCYRAPIPLGTPLHQDQQRAYKVDYQVQVKYAGIRPVEAGFEVDGLFGDVAVPDEHELVEPEVGPEDREGELELTEVMQVLFVDKLEIPLVLKVDDEQG